MSPSRTTQTSSISRIHAFDLVIADECHRGYTSAELSVWRNTLDHFDAIKIGLTATPAAHTKAYFKDICVSLRLRAGRPRGLSGGLRRRDGRSRTSGSKAYSSRKASRSAQVDTETGAEQLDLLEDERQFDATEIERKVTRRTPTARSWRSSRSTRTSTRSDTADSRRR